MEKIPSPFQDAMEDDQKFFSNIQLEQAKKVLGVESIFIIASEEKHVCGDNEQGGCQGFQCQVDSSGYDLSQLRTFVMLLTEYLIQETKKYDEKKNNTEKE